MVFKKLFGRLAESAYRGAAFSWQASEVCLAGKKSTVKKGEKREEEKKE